MVHISVGGQIQKNTKINGTDGSCYRAKYHSEKIDYNLTRVLQYIITIESMNYSSNIMTNKSVLDLLLHGEIQPYMVKPECTEGLQNK